MLRATAGATGGTRGVKLPEEKKKHTHTFDITVFIFLFFPSVRIFDYVNILGIGKCFTSGFIMNV